MYTLPQDVMTKYVFPSIMALMEHYLYIILYVGQNTRYMLADWEMITFDHNSSQLN